MWRVAISAGGAALLVMLMLIGNVRRSVSGATGQP
jgi:hypothetical protein